MGQPREPTTVLLVDDHSVVREGLRELLSSQSDMHVVGEAGDSDSALALTGELRPDVVLLDIDIPGDDVITTVNRIRNVSPESQVIVLSMYEGPQLVRSLLGVGIRGYLLKTVHWENLVRAIRTVRDDAVTIVLEVSRESLAHVREASSPVLSEREREVLELTAQALSNTQIASRLSLTEATVKRHLRNIFVKLGAVSRIDAVNKAIEASLITPRKPVHAPLWTESPRRVQR